MDNTPSSIRYNDHFLPHLSVGNWIRWWYYSSGIYARTSSLPEFHILFKKKEMCHWPEWAKPDCATSTRMDDASRWLLPISPGQNVYDYKRRVIENCFFSASRTKYLNLIARLYTTIFCHGRIFKTVSNDSDLSYTLW